MPAEEAMNKKALTVSLVIACAAAMPAFAFGTKDSEERNKQVVVYAYDSFAGEWGASEQIEQLFEAQTGYDLVIVNCGSAMETVSRAVLEKKSPQADVIIGIDNNMADLARKEGILSEYKPKNTESLIPGLHEALGSDWKLTPYDYSHFALIYDTKSSVPAPTSLSDLTKSIYKNKLILMDPRTSSTGLGFVAWTVSVFGKNTPAFTEFWKALKPNILSMAPSWSTGWGMFTKGEAPLVISYTTSPASEVEYNNNNRYKSLLFSQGHVMQVEGMGILKGARNSEGAKAFIDFFISTQAQELLPLTQWMYPANKNASLPKSYTAAAPVPSKTLASDTDATNSAIDEVIRILSQ